MAYTKNSLKTEWIKNPSGITLPVVDWAKGFGGFLATDEQGYKKPKKLSTTQIRKFLGKVKRMQAKGYDSAEMTMLIPLLEYARGKDKGNTKIADFAPEMIKAIIIILQAEINNEKKEDKDKENIEQYFKNFGNLMEAIVAYHRAEGGQ
jgi:CRISPR type III-A-associated protein Csm2